MKHTLVLRVLDQPGVLNRVASLLRRRAFNIDSLTVGRTEVPEVSRMTIVVDTDRVPAHLVEANVRKLVPVLDVQDVSQMPSVERDLALIRVRCDDSTPAPRSRCSKTRPRRPVPARVNGTRSTRARDYSQRTFTSGGGGA